MEHTKATKARLRSPTTQRFAARHPQLAAEAKLMQQNATNQKPSTAAALDESLSTNKTC